MKKFLLLLCIFFITQQAYCIELEQIKAIKPTAYRLGTSNKPELRYSEIEAIQQKKLEAETIYKQKQEYLEKITYTDTTLKKISNELYKELTLHNNVILADLRLLWVGAASKSETIKFAIYKLSNTEKDEPSTNPIKKIIKPLASVTSLASLGIGDPITSTTAMIGSNLLGAFSYDNKDLNYKYTRVTDADMVVLMNRIEDLQNQILLKYTNYMCAKGALQMSYEVMAKRFNYFINSQNLTDNEIIINDAYYREAQNNYERQKAEFETKRAELEQLVGNKTLIDFEKSLKERE